MKPRATQLDGWKEIACHLKRSVRCVQRWARNERLPVKRHRHRGGVSVYAFPDELDSWWRNEWSNWSESPNRTADLSVRNESEGRRDAAEGEGRIAGIDHRNTRNQHEIEQIAWGGALFFLWVLQALTIENASKELEGVAAYTIAAHPRIEQENQAQEKLGLPEAMCE